MSYGVDPSWTGEIEAQNTSEGTQFSSKTIIPTVPPPPGARSSMKTVRMDRPAGSSSNSQGVLSTPLGARSQEAINPAYRSQQHEMEESTDGDDLMEEGGTFYRRPVSRKRRVVLIKDDTLFYEGEKFRNFLSRFELAAEAVGAEEYDMVRQICRFVKGEELKEELEEMDGYEERDWDRVRQSMIEIWGESQPTIKHTIQDLKDLSESHARKGGIKNYQEYKIFYSQFIKIVKYLLSNEHISDKKDVVYIYLGALDREIQRNVRRELMKNKKITFGKDGFCKPPKFEDLVDATEMELKADTEDIFGYGRAFAESSRIIQKGLDEKKGDGKKREKMLEDSKKDKMEERMDSMTKTMESLTQVISKVIHQPA